MADTTCAYRPYSCPRSPLPHFSYCSLHILSDRSAPFRPCGYICSGNGRRCSVPTSTSGGRFCSEHAGRAAQAQERSRRRRAPPKSTPEFLLSSLSHYSPKSTITEVEDSDVDVVTPAPDPFTDVDANKVNGGGGSRVLDYASDPDSDHEPVTFGNSYRQPGAESSGAESDGVGTDDPLRCAGTLTAEEVSLIARDKLIRQQSLYIQQFGRLQHLLREGRRRYLREIRLERQMEASSIPPAPASDQTRAKLKLSALWRYRRHRGIAAAMRRKAWERRAGSTGSIGGPRCTHAEGGVRCPERVLPGTRFCKRHILRDPFQRLFRPCGAPSPQSGGICLEPILDVFPDEGSCVCHSKIPEAPTISAQVLSHFLFYTEQFQRH